VDNLEISSGCDEILKTAKGPKQTLVALHNLLINLDNSNKQNGNDTLMPVTEL